MAHIGIEPEDYPGPLVDLDYISEKSFPKSKKKAKKPKAKLSPCVKRTITLARIEANREKATFVDVRHMLVAMLQEGRNFGAIMMDANGITIEGIRKTEWNGK